MRSGKIAPCLPPLSRGKRGALRGPRFEEYENRMVLKVLNRWLGDRLAFQTQLLNQPGTAVPLTYDAEDITSGGLAVAVKSWLKRSAG
jgi:hypothetical protein